MANLIYSAITSLDGYVADEAGNFDWAVPDEEVHAFLNDLERPIGTYLYGRRMYEVMAGWETAHTLPDRSRLTRDFAAIWQAADKIVYSTTLETVSSARTSGPASARSSSRGRWNRTSSACERPWSPRYSDPSARAAP